MTAAAARLREDETVPAPVEDDGRLRVAVGVNEEDDAALVKRAGRGDEKAFEAIYFRHRDWVVRVALRFTGERELALDVAQETFAYLVRRLPSLTLTARLTTFLYPAVKHLAESARRRARRGGGPIAADIAASGGTDAVLDDGELTEALAGLSDEHREVLLMRYAHEMMPTEIAAALKIPVGTAKSRLFAASAALRERLRG